MARSGIILAIYDRATSRRSGKDSVNMTQILIVKDGGGVTSVRCPEEDLTYWVNRINELEPKAEAGITVMDDWLIESLSETRQPHNPRPGAEYGVDV